MSTKIKIPKGWRKLKVGTKRKAGDRHYMAFHHTGKKWHNVALLRGEPVMGIISSGDMEAWGPYIRRIPKKRKSK